MGSQQIVRTVVVTDYIEEELEWEREHLAENGIELRAYQLKGRPEQELLEACSGAELIVVNMAAMTSTLIDRLPECRAIIRHGIGYDNVDVEACTRNGIQFANQPDYCAVDVAEHAIALIFSCARRLFDARRSLERSSQRREWDFSGLFPVRRMEGKTVGIVGLGRIGTQVAGKLSSFGFRLLAADPWLPDERFAAAGVERVELEELLAESDFVTIHTPLDEGTRHLMRRESLALMKPTAFLVNTARGPIVDLEALVEALDEGRIAGAALDVYENEPPPPDAPIFGRDNLILTPHMAWASEESAIDIRRKIVDDILSIASGGDARHPVNGIRFSGEEGV